MFSPVLGKDLLLGSLCIEFFSIGFLGTFFFDVELEFGELFFP
ncbi:hypothetical protein RV02_GL002907 [Enterococcus gilvus]|nr:hypothetical protein RV02_GL002907 [Enterococcus gilvus]